MDLTRSEIEYNKIKNLRQYKNFSEEEKRHIAHNRALEYQVDIESLFVNEEDKLVAKTLLRKYLEDYTPETISDVNTLRSILFLEVLNGRLQDELNKAKETNSEMNVRTVEAIHKNLNQILILKESLGLTKDKKDGNVKSVDQKINLIRKQFKVWCDENQATREAVCPYCGQHFILYLRMEHWQERKHPFFKDRVLFNKPLVGLYLENRLTKPELAEILECSPDYIDWVVDRMWKTNPQYQELSKKEEPLESEPISSLDTLIPDPTTTSLEATPIEPIE